MIHLGDSHNFGRRVVRTDAGMIHKPRCLSWEWLFLAYDSPLRNFIDQHPATNNVLSPCATWPMLHFFAGPTGSFLNGGDVEFLQCEPISDDHTLTTIDAEAIGGAIGMCAWFGLSDLHFENIAFGRNSDGKLIWGPLDIEGAFADFALLSQTLLLPAEGLAVGIPGLTSVLKLFTQDTDSQFVGFLCKGYVNSFKFLNDIETEILDVIANALDLAQTPNRLIFRPTREYLTLLRGESHAANTSPICDEERKQLARGDVPYFFHYLPKLDVYAYLSLDRTGVVELPIELTDKTLSYCSSWGDGRPQRRMVDQMMRTGVMQLARALDRGIDVNIFAGDANLIYDSDEILFMAADDLKIKVRRKPAAVAK